jgi:hypothetical protein
MIRISESKTHEMTNEGLKVFLEGPTNMALVSPEAQRMVYTFAKQSGYLDYGMNKFVDSPPEPGKSAQGYWLLKPTQWNTRSVRV